MAVFSVYRSHISPRSCQMRTLPIALFAAAVAFPSLGYPQDQGKVGGPVGANLESPSSGQPGSPSGGGAYERPLPAPQEKPGYAGAVAPGQVAPRNTAVTPHAGGAGTAYVGGHRVLIDPSTNRITRILN
jgi:hypothetical protein